MAPTTTEGTRRAVDLPVSGEVADCVTARLDAEEVPSSEARAAVVACQNELVFAPQFVAGLQSTYPGVFSDEQLGCLTDGFADLSAVDASALLEAGFSQSADGDAEAEAVLEKLFADCGAGLPGG